MANWTYSKSGKYRYIIETDYAPYDDSYVEDLDINIFAKWAERRFIKAQIQEHGVWGYTIEVLTQGNGNCPTCGQPIPKRWDRYESMWGIIGKEKALAECTLTFERLM